MMEHEPPLPFDDLPEQPPAAAARFDGETYDHERDSERLTKQARGVWLVISDRQWYTLAALEGRTGYPQASISARLRDFRKPRFGAHTIERRCMGGGLFEYRLGDVA
jgi:hypothetical protein